MVQASVRGSASTIGIPMAVQNSRRAEGGVQRQYLRRHRFRFFDAPELGEHRRQEAVGNAQARIGVNGATCGVRRFVVAAAQKMPEGERLVGDIVQAVEWADPQRPLRPVDCALRFAGVGQRAGAEKQRESRRRTDCQRLLESFKRRGAIMFDYRNDKSAKRQRRRIVAAIGEGGARMPDGGVSVLSIDIRGGRRKSHCTRRGGRGRWRNRSR